ncbi:MAG: type VI secretion system membrane subunit TssM, partial [Calditrichaeota bacterium]
MKLSNMLRNKLILVSLGLFFLIIILILGGKLLHLSSVYIFLSVIPVLILWIIILFVSTAKSSKNAAGIENSMRGQADQQLLKVRASKRDEYDEFNARFLEAINLLKNSSLGKQKGKTALYALPWYMFIGPPASGKTTAIINGDLEFHTGMQKEVKGVGGTRNCDWFFSNYAILLDTAGRYVADEENKEEWTAFLEILKKYRSKQPINGVLVGISITDLANTSIDRILDHADRIRKRIDELILRLGVRFPVYLVFTKSDLIQGFIEFFGELDRSEQQQVIGCTFEKGQYETTNPGSIFDAEFEQMLQNIADFRLKRLNSPLKREIRQKVFVFPIELASLKDNLRHFIERLFQFNPYQESPIFRGFYFSSGTQVGVPIDRVIKAIAEKVGLPLAAVEEISAPTQPKSYFLRDLFTKVVFPDEYLGSKTAKRAKSLRLVRAITAVLSILGLGLFSLGLIQGFVRSRVQLQEVYSVSSEVAKIDWQNDHRLFSYFEKADKLQKIISKADRHFSVFSMFGLDRRKAVAEP